MRPFKQMIRDVERAFNRKKIEASIRASVLRNKQVIIDTINQEQLINKGISGDGRSISSFQNYTKKTIAIKQDKGQIWNRVTLDDTGKKYKQGKLKSIKGGFESYSTVSYFSELEKKYGESAFKMTEANIEDFTKHYIVPRIVEDIKKRINS